MKTRKAFTLVELLIVIAIIGILAVALLPGILKSPAKGRDTERINELRSVKDALIDAHIALATYPTTTDQCIDATATDFSGKFATSFADGVPVDPTKANASYPGTTAKGCITNGEYLYVYNSTSKVPAVIAKLETLKLANTGCSYARANAAVGTGAVAGALPTTEEEACYIYTLPTK